MQLHEPKNSMTRNEITKSVLLYEFNEIRLHLETRISENLSQL